MSERARKKEMASNSRGPSTSGKGKSKSKSNNSSLVHQFCSVTGADEVLARQMLEACNGNLEMAINMHVDGECPASRTGTSTQPEEPVIPPDDTVRAPFPPVRAVLVEEGFGFGLRTRKRASHSVFDGFRDFQAEARIQEQQLNSLSPSAYKKRKTLEDLFRPPLDLIHHGSFDSARSLGQSQNKWLMVNIQNGREFACQVLNRDVWSSASVKNIVKDHFIFWQVYHDSEEGQRYVQFYKVIEYPYVAVLDPLTGEKLVSWSKIEISSFCDILSEFLNDQPSPDSTTTHMPKFTKNATSIVDKTEEQQLQAAIQASLEENELEEQHQVSEQTTSAATVDSTSDEESIDLETFDSDTETSAASILQNKNKTEAKELDKMHDFIRPASPDGEWMDHIGPDTDPKSQLILRFPDGERKQFSLACTSKLQALLMYIVAQGFSEEDFEVVTTFPRQQLSSLPRDNTLKELGLFPRETIYIQSKNT